MNNLFSNLPYDIIKYILLYDNHFILRNNKIICINKISKNDNRYKKLKDIPKIYQMNEKSYNVILGNNKIRFVLGFSNKFVHEWFYYFHTFNYEPLMKNWIENYDNAIYKLKK